jgi:4'-phosphopantetheinyl transferase
VDAVHVHLGRVSRLLAQGPGLAWLSPAEHTRHDRIAAARRREQFVAGRWLARQLLATVCGGTPAQWRLSAPEHGPPLIEQGPGGIYPHISLSHSGDYVACAIAPVPLGLDVEAPRRVRDWAALVGAICNAREATQWRLTSAAEQEALFYEYWTLKEAWIKQRGEALSLGRLRLIGAEPVASDALANGRTWHSAGCVLALVCSARLAVRWLTGNPGACNGWRISDLAATGASGLS